MLGFLWDVYYAPPPEVPTPPLPASMQPSPVGPRSRDSDSGTVPRHYYAVGCSPPRADRPRVAAACRSLSATPEALPGPANWLRIVGAIRSYRKETGSSDVAALPSAAATAAAAAPSRPLRAGFLPDGSSMGLDAAIPSPFPIYLDSPSLFAAQTYPCGFCPALLGGILVSSAAPCLKKKQRGGCKQSGCPPTHSPFASLENASPRRKRTTRGQELTRHTVSNGRQRLKLPFKHSSTPPAPYWSNIETWRRRQRRRGTPASPRWTSRRRRLRRPRATDGSPSRRCKTRRRRCANPSMPGDGHPRCLQQRCRRRSCRSRRRQRPRQSG